MTVKFELPVEALEPMFSALSQVKPNQCSRVEWKALQLFRSAVFFELERILQEPDDIQGDKINFEALFQEERERRKRGQLYGESILP